MKLAILCLCLASTVSAAPVSFITEKWTEDALMSSFLQFSGKVLMFPCRNFLCFCLHFQSFFHYLPHYAGSRQPSSQVNMLLLNILCGRLLIFFYAKMTHLHTLLSRVSFWNNWYFLPAEHFLSFFLPFHIHSGEKLLRSWSAPTTAYTWSVQCGAGVSDSFFSHMQAFIQL